MEIKGSNRRYFACMPGTAMRRWLAFITRKYSLLYIH
jgi:hypothetical protein